MPLSRAIVLLAVPMVLEMVMESIFAIADIFWVSKLGADAVAAVGLTESLLTVVYAIGMGMAMGVGAVVSRRIGAKDDEGASRAAAQAIFIGLGWRRCSAVLGGLFGADAAGRHGRLARGDGGRRRLCAPHAGAATSASCLLFLINAAFRGAGDAAISMRALWLANGDQHPARPAVRVRPGTVPAAGRHRRGGGDHHRPQHRRALPACGRSRAARGGWWCARAAPAPRPRDDEDDLPVWPRTASRRR